MPGWSGPQFIPGFKKVEDFLGLIVRDNKFKHIRAGPLMVFLQSLLELLRRCALGHGKSL